MHYYIVDPQKLNQREFERVQNKLYSSLSSYRVSGEVVRATGLRTINQLVENAISHETKTIVAVGSDETLNDVINAIKGREVVCGYIPLVDSEIANILGMGSIENSAKTIGLRRVEEMDLGKVNDNYFLSKLSFGLGPENLGLKSLFNLQNFEVKFSADDQFKASVSAVGGTIVNVDTDPTDGIADVFLLPKLSKLQTLRYRTQILKQEFEKIPGSSRVHINKLQILSPEGLPLYCGNKIIARTPATIEIVPQAIKMIVGKERKF